MSISKHTAILLACAVPWAAHAQTVTEPIVVTASRVSETIDSVTRDLTVITRTMIEQSATQSLAELLALYAGVQFVSNGNAGAASGLFLRGANTNQTLVLIDGQRASSSTAGTTTLEAIPLSMIERIEIVRGPHSAVYGADALGGVVHVFTRSGLARSAAVMAGSDRSAHASARLATQASDWTLGLTVSAERSDGFNAVTNPQNFSYNPDRDGFRRMGVQARATLALSPGSELGARVFHNRLNTQYDGGPDFDDRAKTAVSGVALYGQWGGTRVQLGVSEDDARFISAFPGTFRTRISEASAQHTWTWPTGLQATAIVEAREEAIASTDAFVEDRRRTVSAVGRLAGNPSGLAWNLAARIDHSNQFDTRLTGSAGLRLALRPGLAWIANVGTAFKAPTFNDLYYPGFSNPALRPERSLGADTGIKGTYGATEFSAMAHLARVTDLIVFQCDENFHCAPQNVNRARTTGVSFTAQHRIGAHTVLRASLDAQTPRNERTERALPRRADVYGSVFAAHRMGRVHGFVTVTASGRRFDDAANTRRLGGFARIDLGADIELSRQWHLELRAKNVADRAIVLASDFATAGRELSAGVRWSDR